MIRKIYSCGGGILLLAGAVLFATPGSSWARPGHGGGGGGRGGGAHFGGVHVGGGRGGHFGGVAHFGGARVGGAGVGHIGGGFYRGGAYHYGHGYSRPYNGYRHYYYPYRYSYGLYPSYGSGYYPYYYSDYGTYPDLSSSLPTDPGPGGDSAGQAVTAYPDDTSSAIAPATGGQSDYPTTTTTQQQQDSIAHVTATLPSDAKVWFDGTLMNSTGSVRDFKTPTLVPGSRYYYDVKATWNQNGRQVTQTQRVKITAGAHVNVRFPVPAGEHK
jgi:uncharacterized protein (TIGR03000 family)